MRVTLEIDDELIEHAKVVAKQNGCTLDEAVSGLVANGLAQLGVEPSEKFTFRNGVPVFLSRGEVVTPEKIRKIMDEEGI